MPDWLPEAVGVLLALGDTYTRILSIHADICFGEAPVDHAFKRRIRGSLIRLLVGCGIVLLARFFPESALTALLSEIAIIFLITHGLGMLAMVALYRKRDSEWSQAIFSEIGKQAMAAHANQYHQWLSRYQKKQSEVENPPPLP
ncbi:MAG: hypothetical protein IAE89_05460 [Anaerolineae bacterium]|nr:hypothetical protein [Anaerolineae bacterium]